MTVNLEFQGGVGVSRKISRRFNVGVEMQVMASDNDLLDGFAWRTDIDQSNNADIGHYFNVRLGVNLGDFSKRTEPLYWLNPFSIPMGDIAELKSKPVVEGLIDTDTDGVIDQFDKQPNTPRGAPVDTRGVTLDSDNDGIDDFEDAEPYSPIGYDIDNRGVAKIPPAGLTEQEVEEIVVERMARMQAEWFLPMVHFDADDYSINPSFYPELNQIGSLLQNNPDMKMVVHGFADNRNASGYNEMLSFNRSKEVIDYISRNFNIGRERLILNYGGESSPIVPNLPDNQKTQSTQGNQEFQYYLNRRVEFRVATPEDKMMAKPKGSDAGKKSESERKPGTNYKGNKTSGGGEDGGY